MYSMILAAKLFKAIGILLITINTESLVQARPPPATLKYDNSQKGMSQLEWSFCIAALLILIVASLLAAAYWLYHRHRNGFRFPQALHQDEQYEIVKRMRPKDLFNFERTSKAARDLVVRLYTTKRSIVITTLPLIEENNDLDIE